MHRDTNKWRQHVLSSGSSLLSLSLPLIVSMIISLTYLTLSLPLSNNSLCPCFTLTFYAYQGFISVHVLLQAQGFRWIRRCLAPAPLVMTATIWPVMRNVSQLTAALCISMSCLPYQYSLIASDLQPGGNPLFLPVHFCPSPSTLASSNSNSPLLCMWDYDKTALLYQFPLRYW